MRSIDSAAIAGVIYAALTLAALLLFRQLPDLSLSDQAISIWFDDEGHRSTLVLALSLVSMSSVAFLWFVAVIRRRIGDREDRFFATVFLGSAILYLGTYIAGAVALAAPAVAFSILDGAAVDNASVTLTAGTAAGMLLVVGPRIQAVFIFATSTLILRTEAMPSWLAYVGYVMGLVLFVIPLVLEPIVVGFPLWVLIVSVTIGLTRPALQS
jgi:hypothetical protein